MVIYDFDLPDRPTSDALIGAMKSLRVDWRQLTETVYLIDHPGVTLFVRNALEQYFRAHSGGVFIDSDRLLVAKLTGEMAWSSSFSEADKDWLLEKAGETLAPSSVR